MKRTFVSAGGEVGGKRVADRGAPCPAAMRRRYAMHATPAAPKGGDPRD